MENVLSQSHIAIATALSGIVASLLKFDHTEHFIVRDKSSMVHRHLCEALDKFLSWTVTSYLAAN